MPRDPREAIARTAKRIQDQSRKTGQRVTFEQAREKARNIAINFEKKQAKR